MLSNDWSNNDAHDLWENNDDLLITRPDLIKKLVAAATNATTATSSNAPVRNKMVKEADEPVMTDAQQYEHFAKLAMRELAANKLEDFVLLKNDKLRNWWKDVLEAEEHERRKQEAIAHRAALREQGLAKLSDEEKAALGLGPTVATTKVEKKKTGGLKLTCGDYAYMDYGL
jgi:hypothetical protein